MSKWWFYARGTSVIGPIEVSQLKSLIVSGKIQPGDMVIRAGETKWVAAASVPELLPTAALATPLPRATPAVRGKTLALVGVLVAMLLCGALTATTIFYHQETHSLRVQLTELEQERKYETDAKKLPEALAEIARLQSAREQDAKTIKDLRQQLAKFHPVEQSIELPPAKEIEWKRIGYEKIDRHALQAPPEVEKSLPTLAKYLTAPAQNDEEKARALFRWITDRIEYDADALFNRTYPDQSTVAVLKTHKALCAGFARLYKEMGELAGLRVELIQGFGKGITGKFDETTRSNHAWNAVKLHGEWHLLDASWAAGGIVGKKFVKRFTDFYYLTPPDLMIIDHFPLNPRWQLLDPPMSVTTFQMVSAADTHKVQGLFTLGLLKKETLLEDLKNRKDLGWVKHYSVRGPALTFQIAPVERELRAGTNLHIKLEAPTFDRAAIIVNGRFVELPKQEGNLFEGTARLEAGKATVAVHSPSDLNYQLVLEYVVR